jgi:hypothetical protein
VGAGMLPRTVKPLAVEAYDPAVFAQLANSITAGAKLAHNRWSPTPRLTRYIGLAGTLLLHGLAVHSISLGSHKSPQHELEESGVQRKASVVSPADALMLITLIDNPSPDTDPLGGAPLPALALDSIRGPIKVAEPTWVSVAGSDDNPTDSPPVAVDAGDSPQRALMYGHYTAQIGARIERAWIRPRSSVTPAASRGGRDQVEDDQRFRCKAQIRQDINGYVHEVLLLACNGTEEWRRSLVVAINQASPLPSPPVPKVFSASISLIFEAEAYRPGAPADEYESAGKSAASVPIVPTTRAAAPPPNAGIPFRWDGRR